MYCIYFIKIIVLNNKGIEKQRFVRKNINPNKYVISQLCKIYKNINDIKYDQKIKINYPTENELLDIKNKKYNRKYNNFKLYNLNGCNYRDFRNEGQLLNETIQNIFDIEMNFYQCI